MFSRFFILNAICTIVPYNVKQRKGLFYLEGETQSWDR